MSTTSRIVALETAFPARQLTNEDLASQFESWTADKIALKLGITSRYVLSGDETPSDIAVAAAQRIFATGSIKPSSVDYLVFCSQAPDYALPTTACIIHEKLGLRKSAGSIDINQGCSGYIHGLALSKGLIESNIAKRVMLLTADGYSRFVGNRDASVKTLFGDGATATVLDACYELKNCDTDKNCRPSSIDHFVFGTDGTGADKLIVKNSGYRLEGDGRRGNLFMDGPAVLQFTLREIPLLKRQILAEAELSMEDIDYVVLHQANKFLLEQLERKLKIPREKHLMDMEDVGNTVSSTIPIVLSRAIKAGVIQRGHRLLLAGFGVGLSWGGCLLTY